MWVKRIREIWDPLASSGRGVSQQADTPTQNRALFSAPPAEMSALGPWLAQLDMFADPIARGIGTSPSAG